MERVWTARRKRPKKKIEKKVGTTRAEKEREKISF